MRDTQLVSALASSVWAVQSEYWQHMQAVAHTFAEGGQAADQVAAALKANLEVEAARRQQITASTGGSVMVLPLYGLITQRSSWMSYFFGGTTTEAFTLQLRQAMADPNVTAIVIDVDSPGGSVAGVDELAAEIFAARSKKTILAISDTLNASAAYYLSSQASELYVMPSSLTGSIGVYQAHQDISGYLEQAGVKMTLISAGRFKVEGNSYEPLDASALDSMQQLVDGYYDQFVAAVARGRKVKAAAVKSGFGEGRVVMAKDAVALGMADKIGTLDTVLARFGVQRTGQDSFLAASETEVPAAETEQVPVEVVAAKKDEGGQTDDTVDDNDGDDLCQCDCAPCSESNSCLTCNVDDCKAVGCSCGEASRDSKAKTEATAFLALQLQKIRLALAL